MKKYIIIASLAVGTLAYGQINVQTGLNTSIGNENPFLDASGYINSDNNIGKGLYFPTADLTIWEFKTNLIDPETFSTYFDGMIVYNSASGQTIEDTTKGGKQVKVEPGFYYFKNPNQVFPNGSIANGEWIRLNDSFANDQEWKFNPTNQRIELVRSGEGTFKNKVYYTKEGGYYNYEDTTIDYLYPGANSVITPTSDGTKNYTQINSKSINYLSDDFTGLINSRKSMGRNIFHLDETMAPTSSNTIQIYNKEFETITSPTNVVATEWLAGVRNRITKQDNQDTRYISSSNGSVYVFDGSITGYAAATRSETFITSPRNHNMLTSQVNLLTATDTSGNINSMRGIDGSILLRSGNTSTINELSAIAYTTRIRSASVIDNMYGIKYKSDIKLNENPTITNHYGLYLEDIDKATNNYAIFTKAGNIRFGDLADRTVTGERLVVANTDGVLSTSATPLSDLESLWENDTTNNLVKLKNLADGTTPRTDSGDDRNSVTIDNEGAITAKGFFGYNGAKIYPDYVFQKYYTGKSDIKANYTFKNLNEIENFVKTNGYLPGYQSAKEVKAQGYIDVLSTQLTNVEKIEELYLHTIAQEKEIKAKDAKINELEKDVQELKGLVQQLLNK